MATVTDAKPNPLRVVIGLSWACIVWFVIGLALWTGSMRVPHSVEEFAGFGIALAGAVGAVFALLYLLLVARTRERVIHGSTVLLLNGAAFCWFWFFAMKDL